MSRAFPTLRKKCKMNSGPRSEVASDGIPCLEKTWITNNSASCAEVIVSKVGIKMPCLDIRSMMTKIEVKPAERGRCSIKSIEIEDQGREGIGSCLRRPYGL